jgi:hypothetical protein
MGFMAAKLLFTANEIGLFEALAHGTADVEELASRIAVPARTTAIVAATMVSLGLIEQEEGRYRNSAAASTFLAGQPGVDLRMALRFWNGINYPLWQKLEEAVSTGHGQAQFGEFDQAQQQMYSAGVEAFTGPVAAALATAYDFSPHRRLLDVGGGTGSFLVVLLRQYAQLKGTLFELPGACTVARQRLALEPEGTRIEIIEWDVFETPLPSGHDVLLLSNVAHHCSAPRNVELLKKMRAAVQSGARLLLVDLWADPTHTEPTVAALMSGTFLLISGEGQTYSEQEADGWLELTKWRKLERKELSWPNSLIVAEAI